MTTWGLSATIKAAPRDILNFAAYHVEAGAHRLYLFLDSPNPEALAHLQAHPKVRVTICDQGHWEKLTGKRPAKHQVRQSINATQAYNRKAEVDWLIHLDVDEFLVTDNPVSHMLGALPGDALCARTRPMEQLAGDETAFKAFIPPGRDRARIVRQLYPTYGDFLTGGFLSHVAGKLFTRTRQKDMTIRIHNVFQNNDMNPGMVELPEVSLAHCHAPSWERWISHFGYRITKGAYRSELPAAHAQDAGGMNLHSLFRMIEAEEGELGLRAFFDEVCADTPELRARLEAHDLLRTHTLDLEGARSRQFPEFRP